MNGFEENLQTILKNLQKIVYTSGFRKLVDMASLETLSWLHYTYKRSFRKYWLSFLAYKT
jgi:hypothetical protein